MSSEVRGSPVFNLFHLAGAKLPRRMPHHSYMMTAPVPLPRAMRGLSLRTIFLPARVQLSPSTTIWPS